MNKHHANESASNSQAIFSMPLIGTNLARLRRQKGLTQMQLANELGISFQAVSNWERGLSCPDISKLAELSHLLEASIDDLLGNTRTAQIVQEFSQDSLPDMTLEEVRDMAPMLSEKQVEQAVTQQRSGLSCEDLVVFAPFLSTEALDQLAEGLSEAPGSFSELIPLAPFLSEKTLDKLAEKVAPSPDSFSELVALAPFLSSDALARLLGS